jgi:hypothetical protein
VPLTQVLRQAQWLMAQAKVGDYIKGQMAAKADPGMAYKPDVRTPTAGQGAGQSYDAGGTFASTAENPGVRRLANWAVKNFDQNTYDYVPKGMDVFVYDKAGNLVQSITSDPSMRRAGIYTGKQMLDVMKKSAGVYESINLSESQIFLLIGKIVARQRKLDEGIMDTIKGAAGKAVDWAKTKGTNLTTKITADKLLQAWKKAGSPTDSLGCGQSNSICRCTVCFYQASLWHYEDTICRRTRCWCNATTGCVDSTGRTRGTCR